MAASAPFPDDFATTAAADFPFGLPMLGTLNARIFGVPLGVVPLAGGFGLREGIMRLLSSEVGSRMTRITVEISPPGVFSQGLACANGMVWLFGNEAYPGRFIAVHSQSVHEKLATDSPPISNM